MASSAQQQSSNGRQIICSVDNSGEPDQFVGCVSLFRALMYEADLGRVMSGAEKAPTVAEDADAVATATHQRNLRKFPEKNGKLTCGYCWLRRTAQNDTPARLRR